jgi:hypothetical protein
MFSPGQPETFRCDPIIRIEEDKIGSVKLLNYPTKPLSSRCQAIRDRLPVRWYLLGGKNSTWKKGLKQVDIALTPFTKGQKASKSDGS